MQHTKFCFENFTGYDHLGNVKYRQQDNIKIYDRRGSPENGIYLLCSLGMLFYVQQGIFRLHEDKGFLIG